MALQGNFVTSETIVSETNTITHTITYPVDLPETHPDYDKRGTSEEVFESEITKVPTTHSNKYIWVKSANISTISIDDNGDKVYILDYVYRIYNSSSERDSNIDSHILERESTINWDFESMTEPYNEAYKDIKNLQEIIEDNHSLNNI